EERRERLCYLRLEDYGAADLELGTRAAVLRVSVVNASSGASWQGSHSPAQGWPVPWTLSSPAQRRTLRQSSCPRGTAPPALDWRRLLHRPSSRSQSCR